MLDLANVVNFGAIDADADRLLADCFQDHEAYLRARDNEAFLILGRKGSGKTAIYHRLLADDGDGRVAVGHGFDDYPWPHHDLQAESGVPEELRFVHSWKYLTLITLCKALLNTNQGKPWAPSAKESFAAIKEFVVDSYGTTAPDPQLLFRPEKELRISARFNTPLVSVGAETIPVRELPRYVHEINRAMLAHVLASLDPNRSYYVCFDQLDRHYSRTRPEYSQRLTGLVLAARDLFLEAKRAKKKLNIVVFLRDDIYDDLQFEDKNKLTSNYSAMVRWSEAGRGLTLRNLMESRFAAASGQPGAKIAWDEVFDETQEMSGRQTKYRHICDRTFLRPRDMIMFCNAILAAYQADDRAPGELVGNACISTARHEYSDYLLRELDDEIAKQVPHYKEYLAMLQMVGRDKFTLSELHSIWSRRPGPIRSAKDVDTLATLFDFSVVGYLKSGGRGGGSEYAWRYLDPRARFDYSAETFRVHPGFKEALDLRKTVSRST